MQARKTQVSNRKPAKQPNADTKYKREASKIQKSKQKSKQKANKEANKNRKNKLKAKKQAYKQSQREQMALYKKQKHDLKIKKKAEKRQRAKKPRNRFQKKGFFLLSSAGLLYRTIRASGLIDKNKPIQDRVQSLFSSVEYRDIIDIYKELEKNENSLLLLMVFIIGIGVAIGWAVVFFFKLPLWLFILFGSIWLIGWVVILAPQCTAKALCQQCIEPLCSSCAEYTKPVKLHCKSERVSYVYHADKTDETLAFLKFLFSIQLGTTVKIEKIARKELMPTYQQVGEKIIFSKKSISVFSGFSISLSSAKTIQQNWDIAVENYFTYKQALQPFSGMHNIPFSQKYDWETFISNKLDDSAINKELLAKQIQLFLHNIGIFDIYVSDTTIQVLLPVYSVRDTMSIIPLKTELKDKWFMSAREFETIAKLIYIVQYMQMFSKNIGYKEVCINESQE